MLVQSFAGLRTIHRHPNLIYLNVTLLYSVSSIELPGFCLTIHAASLMQRNSQWQHRYMLSGRSFIDFTRYPLCVHYNIRVSYLSFEFYELKDFDISAFSEAWLHSKNKLNDFHTSTFGPPYRKDWSTYCHGRFKIYVYNKTWSRTFWKLIHLDRTKCNIILVSAVVSTLCLHCCWLYRGFI